MKEHVRRILQIPPNLMAMNAVSTANHNNSNNNPNITTISLATTTIAAAGGIPTPPPPPPPSILSTTVKRPLPPPPPAKRTSSNNNKERYHPGLEVEHALASYLRQSVDSFDLTKNTEVFVLLLFSFIAFGLYYFNSFFVVVILQDVCNQIWATLFDYPCLQSCDGLVKYIKDSVRLAWSLVNQVNLTQIELANGNTLPSLKCINSYLFRCSRHRWYSNTKQGTLHPNCMYVSIRPIRTKKPSRPTCGQHSSKDKTAPVSIKPLLLLKPFHKISKNTCS